MIIMCSIGITLSDSKAGILSLILLSVYYLILFISKQKRYIQIFTIFLITIISLFGLKKIEKTRFSELNKSFHLEKQKEYTGNYNSTEIRIIIWRSVNQLILGLSIFVNLKNQHPILIIFNLLMVFNFLFESILESKAGIEIFTLFNILLSSKIIPPKYSNTDYSVI